MTVHHLKADPEPFEQAWLGNKLNEIRFDDRNYVLGDTIELHETRSSSDMMRYKPSDYPLSYTGRQIHAKVTHIQKGYGLMHGWVALSFSKITQGEFR